MLRPTEAPGGSLARGVCVWEAEYEHAPMQRGIEAVDCSIPVYWRSQCQAEAGTMEKKYGGEAFDSLLARSVGTP